MKLLICVITHNRLDYTKDCLKALNENTPPPDYMVVVVDNASTDGTVEWLKDEGVTLYDALVLNSSNRYPGAACNQGWQEGLDLFPEENFTHLCRLDNDCVVQKGWDEQVKLAFESFDKLGQFGLIDMKDSKEFPYKVIEENGGELNVGPSNIGGPNVIVRELWDQGLRYQESKWINFGGPMGQEDVALSLDIKGRGYRFGNTVPFICKEQSFDDTDKYFDYYCRTFAERGHGRPARTKNGVVLEAGTDGERDHI